MMNMSRYSRVLVLLVALATMAACGRVARMDVTVSDAPSSEVTVRLLDMNRYQILDTVAVNADGRFSYKVPVADGQPEFVYLFYKDTKIASLILEKGDHVVVETDTSGNYNVSGSEECVRLARVEKDYAAAVARLNSLSSRLSATEDVDEALELRRLTAQEYVKYYRECVKYVMANAKSLTVIPVLYQNFGENLPVFGQATDAIHFRNIADSLEMKWPESKYVKALVKEAERRFGYLELETRLSGAAEIGFPDIELPDLKGSKRKLSEVDAKVTMLYFWSATDAAQKMYNLDVLAKVYGDYASKGLEIYQVALDPDKAVWAKTVKEQNLPWINVCDSRGGNSPYVASYNLSVLPVAYFIKDGEIVNEQAVDEKSLRKVLTGLLK